MPKTKVTIAEVRTLMRQVCISKGLTLSEADMVIDNYLEAEMTGKDTHGIGKFLFESQFFDQRQPVPRVISDTGPLLKLDGRKEVGPIAAEYAIELACERSQQYGISIVGVDNIQRYGVLRTWARRFAEHQMFGLVMNSCEPAMAGHGGNKKVLGTNPMAFAIPVKNKIYVVDMSTSKVAMSLIWKSLREGSDLPLDTFYDTYGQVTTNPKEAKAVKVFGDMKGYNIALLIQLICGSLFGFKTGSAIKNMYDIGYVFLAIDPAKTSSYESFIDSNNTLIEELAKSGAVIPGQRSLNKEKAQTVNIDDKMFAELKKLGERL